VSKITQLLDGDRIAVMGLGYVGLPLAVEFGKKYDTIGYDINAVRVADLRIGNDRTLEVEPELMAQAARLSFTDQLDDIADCNVYIVTVPTPIDAVRRPDLSALIEVSGAIGRLLNSGDTVIYESTVYPGCTEEICVAILEHSSGLSYDGAIAPPPPSAAGIGAAGTFSVGYSPERINPGDQAHRVTSIVKVTSGSTPEAADFVDALYSSVITAGTHKAPSIKVAEAAKVIENTQRDLNIALVNDLAILFNRLGIDTLDVLEAAGTKWNFLPFRPGLVGGHCIGVDPYYLTHKAQEVGHHPDVILAGRRTNDGMGQYVAEQVIKLMVRKSINPVGARILVLGLTFKEDCPDIRNTRVVDIIQVLFGYNARVDVYDPWVTAAQAENECGITPVDALEEGGYDAVVLAVGHDQFIRMGGVGVRALGKASGNVVYDVKSVLPRDAVDGRL
jgi:UDP-N-acetyl-D-galactosamine dehydrogenase